MYNRDTAFPDVLPSETTPDMNIFRPRRTKRVFCQLSSSLVVLERSYIAFLVLRQYKANDIPGVNGFLTSLCRRIVFRFALTEIDCSQRSGQPAPPANVIPPNTDRWSSLQLAYVTSAYATNSPCCTLENLIHRLRVAFT